MKLAEDMVTRSSFSTLNNQLLHNQYQLNTPQQLHVAHVSPTINVQGNGASYGGAIVGQHNSNLGFGNLDATFNDVENGVLSNSMSCVTIWP